ncbi:MAG TPA: FAD:protein FMN transferase [Candidatus Binatia bacterium]|nr:FAD:protein FMN transferase [Candidatus Binatia bacterium]
MNSCSKGIEIRRCRPLLGTFVEITATGADECRLQSAVNAAFAAVENIQKLMSVHDADSELSQLNREAASHPVTVSRETFDVLRRADKLAAASDGAFDYTIAPLLARWGILPAPLKRKKFGSWRDVLLLRGRKVYFLQPLALDLGGIAKGFAVDKAIETLRKHGVGIAVVNAGGDLRVLGKEPSWIHLRHPACPQLFADKIQLSNAALATSSPCFTERNWRGRRVSHLVDSARRIAVAGAVSVTVRAQECWLADALTKVVLNAPDLARKLLAKHHAEAFVMNP